MTAADACVAADAGADVVLAPVESLVDAVRVGDVLTTHGDVFHFPGGNGLFRLIEVTAPTTPTGMSSAALNLAAYSMLMP